jgi:hypothetical protein
VEEKLTESTERKECWGGGRPCSNAKAGEDREAESMRSSPEMQL